MTSIVLDEHTYNIPTNWEEITIKHQMTVDQLCKDHSDFRILAVISGYCDIPMDVLKKLHIGKVKDLFSSLKFYNIKLEPTPITDFEYKNEEYSVLQSLLKGEFQDFVSVESILDQYKNDQHKALPYIIAILSKKKIYEPDSKRFHYESLDQFDVDQRAKHFQDLPITIASAIQRFFLFSAVLSSRDSHKVLKELDHNLNESLTSMINTLKLQSGGGLLTRCVRVILQGWIRFLKHRWRKYYSGFTLEKQKQN